MFGRQAIPGCYHPHPGMCGESGTDDEVLARTAHDVSAAVAIEDRSRPAVGTGDDVKTVDATQHEFPHLDGVPVKGPFNSGSKLRSDLCSCRCQVVSSHVAGRLIKAGRDECARFVATRCHRGTIWWSVSATGGI